MPEENENLSDLFTLINDIKYQKLEDPKAIALKTEELVEKVIAEGKWAHAKELLEIIKLQMKVITKELPHEEVSKNVLRHVLKIIREEYEAICKERPECPPHYIFTAKISALLKYSESWSVLKTNILDHLTEYKEELESSTENIVSQGSDLIYTNEVILITGRSSVLEEFLQQAKGKSPQVIVVEDAPSYSGHITAGNLVKSNIDVTLISDAAVFAVMPRVDKVIIDAQTLMSTAGLYAASGVHAILQAAKHYAIQVYVLAETYKLSSLPYQKDTLENFASPGSSLPQSGGATNKAKIINPVSDFVPLDLVTMIITQQGGIDPSYISQVLLDLYNPDDYYI